MALIPYPIIKPDSNPSVVIIHARDKSTSEKKKKTKNKTVCQMPLHTILLTLGPVITGLSIFIDM